MGLLANRKARPAGRVFFCGTIHRPSFFCFEHNIERCFPRTPHAAEPRLRSQKTLEVFNRFQLAEQIALTPDIQYIRDPALSPSHDSLWLLGLRARLAL
ncbi:MAG: carbohydrate porin [Pseudomonadota bacterium]|nr:MAG: carbohydrate porin [Pseudomonadota bacterium]